MANYQWKPTNLIAEKFEEWGYEFGVREHVGRRRIHQ